MRQADTHDVADQNKLCTDRLFGEPLFTIVVGLVVAQSHSDVITSIADIKNEKRSFIHAFKGMIHCREHIAMLTQQQKRCTLEVRQIGTQRKCCINPCPDAAKLTEVETMLTKLGRKNWTSEWTDAVPPQMHARHKVCVPAMRWSLQIICNESSVMDGWRLAFGDWTYIEEKVDGLVKPQLGDFAAMCSPRSRFSEGWRHTGDAIIWTKSPASQTHVQSYYHANNKNNKLNSWSFATTPPTFAHQAFSPIDWGVAIFTIANPSSGHNKKVHSSTPNGNIDVLLTISLIEFKR